jgi:hypothetical protein
MCRIEVTGTRRIVLVVEKLSTRMNSQVIEKHAHGPDVVTTGEENY